MNEFKFEMGDIVKCIITGYKGAVRARAQYLTGCNQYGIQPKGLDEKGGMKPWEWLDETQLELTKEKKVVIKVQYSLNQNIPKGGPRNINEQPPT